MSHYTFSEGFREAEREEIVALLQEYERQIGVSLCFQDFATELAGLPGAYAPPRGTPRLPGAWRCARSPPTNAK
jgi:hypothetical protein